MRQVPWKAEIERQGPRTSPIQVQVHHEHNLAARRSEPGSQADDPQDDGKMYETPLSRTWLAACGMHHPGG